MRIFAFVIAIAIAAGCGSPSTDPNPNAADLSMPDLSGCPPTINEGETCSSSCPYLGDHCHCSTAHVWTCERPDMTAHD